MGALVGNVGDRARYHRRVRKPTKYLEHVLFWFFGNFHHHPDARFKLHYIAKVGIYPVVPCRCKRSGDPAWGTLLYRTTPHRIDRLLRDFYFGWDLMIDNKIYSCGEPSKREGLA